MNEHSNVCEKIKKLDRILDELALLREETADSIEMEAARQTTSDALQRSERTLRDIIENLPQGISIKDKNLIYRFCNKRYAQDLGIDPQDIVGKMDFDFYPKEVAAKYVGDEQRILRTAKAEESEQGCVIAGKELTILVNRMPLKDEAGNVTGILATFWDITERKKAEEGRENYIVRLKEHIAKRSAQIDLLSDQLLKESVERRQKEVELREVKASSSSNGSGNDGGQLRKIASAAELAR